jgi:hypothetical protein
MAAPSESSQPRASKQRAGMPRWFKICGLLAALVVVGFVALHLAGMGLGGGHHHGP